MPLLHYKGFYYGIKPRIWYWDFLWESSLNVAKYRKEANLSQLKLAMLMGLNSVSLVASAETYRKSGKHFNLEHIYKISEILKVDIGLLLK